MNHITVRHTIVSIGKIIPLPEYFETLQKQIADTFESSKSNLQNIKVYSNCTHIDNAERKYWSSGLFSYYYDCM